MAHMHDDVHTTTREVDVVDRGGGFGAGFMLAVVTLLVLAVVGIAVLWARPWDDNKTNSNNPNVPGITNNSGGGQSGGGADNSGGGAAQPAQ